MLLLTAFLDQMKIVLLQITKTYKLSIAGVKIANLEYQYADLEKYA